MKPIVTISINPLRFSLGFGFRFQKVCGFQVIPRMMLILASLVFAFNSVAVAQGSTKIEIVIDEPFQGRTVAWPVTTGVPFPRGELTDVRKCRLVDDQGHEQPLQSRVAATWDAERKSIRWLTLDFIALPKRKYSLEFGPRIVRKRFDSPLVVAAGDPLMVATGSITAEFWLNGPSSLGNIRADLSNNGVIEDSEVVASGPTNGEHYYTDQNRQRFSSAHDGNDRKIVVESTGPVRACVRVDGFYTGPNGERIVGYRTRYHFFVNLGLIKVVDEFRILGSTKETHFRDIGFALNLAHPTDGRVIHTDRASGEHDLITGHWKPTTESVSSYQTTYRHFGNPEYEAAVVEVTSQGEKRLHQTDRAGEWMQVTNMNGSTTGSLRWFWQQFPKEWETTRDQLVLHLWSPRAGELDFGADGLREFFGKAGHKYVLDWKGVRGRLNPISNFFYFAGHGALERREVDGQGINKHHEFYLHFGRHDQSQAGVEYGRLAAHQPLALASGEWNCSTDVFGPLMPRPNDSPYEAIVDRIFDLGRDAQDAFGDYGWWLFGSGPHYSYQWDEETKRHYADPRRFEYHTYQKETQLWWNYLRSGERKFYDWAFPSEDHWIDIATTHVPLKYHCDWRGGFRKQQTLHFRPGDWSIDSAMHYVRQRDSAEAWLRGGSQFWASYHRTLETTALAYYLTGDERYNDVLKYWRNYWRDLAGVTSASADAEPWHREQPWFVPTKPGEPEKSWARMIRDYCPFTSGLRHQMTYFFSLATLYEHTWDPKIGRVLTECAEAYLDPEHRIGVWRTQENGLPRNADAPLLAHYWVPALWKYARATRDPRMKQVFQKYFDACYAADPFREDIGRYSNVHLGYAYYFTSERKHLRPIQLELDRLAPNAEPLQKPQDLGRRIYNPYTPIQSFTAVPRLIWALDAASRDEIATPPAPRFSAQRTAIAVHKQAGVAIRATLWGYDADLKLIGPDAKPFQEFEVTTQKHASGMQPFDRDLREFEVYLHKLVIPADAAAGFYVFTPTLELAVLSLQGEERLLVNAFEPIAVEPGEQWQLLVAGDESFVELESAQPKSIAIQSKQEVNASTRVDGNRVIITMKAAAGPQVLQLENTGKSRLWFRFLNRLPNRCWIAKKSGDETRPTSEQTRAALPNRKAINPGANFVTGRFGKGLQIVPGRTLKIPDHVEIDGKTVRLFDPRQGTIEFWVKRLWDDRLMQTRPVTYLTNGLLQAWCPRKLPLREWAHVAVEWRPLKRDPNRMAVHIYVNGRDNRNYRSTWWEGYSQKPLTMPSGGKWLNEFLCQTQPNAAFAIDELRISSVPRYTDQNVEFGGQQTFNPVHFQQPAQPFQLDEKTLLLIHFDDGFSGSSTTIDQPIQAQLSSTN